MVKVIYNCAGGVSGIKAIHLGG